MVVPLIVMTGLFVITATLVKIDTDECKKNISSTILYDIISIILQYYRYTDKASL